MTEMLAVIPARGGSKGVPGKNLRLLAGKPLIAHQIEAAQKASSVDEIIVSTDHLGIADAAEEAGARVPFLRPSELAMDEVPVIAAVKHAVEYFGENNQIPEYVLCLQPTSPFNTSESIDLANKKMRRTDCDSVVSVERVTETHPYRSYRLDDDKIVPIDGLTVTDPDQRQDRPDVYGFTGAIYLRRSELLFDWDYEDFALGDDVRAVVQSGKESLDIDTEFQLQIARAIANYEGVDQEFPDEVELPDAVSNPES
jgi:CMP-N-acetylneuraminic acid synthetase